MSTPLPPAPAFSAADVPLDARLAERKAPVGRWAVMFQEWSNLLFLHWPMDPEIVQATLPPGLRVDTFDGRAWVGVVPFEMEMVRPRFLPPLPKLSFFLELNIRTYVVDASGRPGVWFYSLDCNQPFAVAVGHRFFRLNYRDAGMNVHDGLDGWRYYTSSMGGGTWEGSSRFRYRPVPGSNLVTAAPGSIEFFFIERYRLFTFDDERQRLLTGSVHHDPYEICPAEVPDFRLSNLFHSNGLPTPEDLPTTPLYSPGVHVRVFSVKKVSED